MLCAISGHGFCILNIYIVCTSYVNVLYAYVCDRYHNVIICIAVSEHILYVNSICSLCVLLCTLRSYSVIVCIFCISVLCGIMSVWCMYLCVCWRCPLILCILLCVVCIILNMFCISSACVCVFMLCCKNYFAYYYVFGCMCLCMLCII